MLKTRTRGFSAIIMTTFPVGSTIFCSYPIVLEYLVHSIMFICFFFLCLLGYSFISCCGALVSCSYICSQYYYCLFSSICQSCIRWTVLHHLTGVSFFRHFLVDTNWWFIIILKLLPISFDFYWSQIASQNLLSQNKWWGGRGVELNPVKYSPPKYYLFLGVFPPINITFIPQIMCTQGKCGSNLLILMCLFTCPRCTLTASFVKT